MKEQDKFFILKDDNSKLIVHLPDNIDEKDEVSHKIKELYHKIEYLRMVENEYLDRVMKNVETLIGKSTVDFVNNNSESELEKWKKILDEEVSRSKVHLDSEFLAAKIEYTQELLNDNLNRVATGATAIPKTPAPPEESSIWKKIKL